jgi:hypothetical protein
MLGLEILTGQGVRDMLGVPIPPVAKTIDIGIHYGLMFRLQWKEPRHAERPIETETGKCGPGNLT